MTEPMNEQSPQATADAAPDDHNKWLALAVLSVSYLMVVLDVSIVNVALRDIQVDLGFAQKDLQWVITGYALTFGGFLLLGGRMGDILGRRRLFMLGLTLFAAFSLMCGLATSPGMLVTARILQGIAAALLAPSVFSIVSVTFQEGAERNKALGILGAVAGSGAAIGLIIGGVLSEKASWHWCFLINVPIAIVVLIATRRYVRESRADATHRHFDAMGAILITSALMILVYALTQASDVGWLSGQTIGLVALSVALHVAFLVVELRSKHPLVPMTFFRKRIPTGANIIGFVLGTIVQGMFVLLSLFMPQVLGYSPIETGLAYMATALTAIVASGGAQALVTRIGVRTSLIIGMSSLAVGLLYLTRIAPDSSYWTALFPGFILMGIGLGFSFVPVSIAALTGVKPHEAGLASGLINTSQQIGGALGVAILVSVANTITGAIDPRHIDAGAAQKLTDGYAGAFFVAAGLAVLGLIVVLSVLRGREMAHAGEDAAVATHM